jgi:hypothetical protein
LVSRLRLNLLFAWQSLVYAIGVLLGTGIISEWGRWYSSNPHYRRQVDALLRGELALSHNPVETVHDLTWSCGGVHQVWGLGVPLWRLPFEALARWVGLPAFPDHFAFGLALALAAFVMLRAFVGGGMTGDGADRTISKARGLMACSLMLPCPVFLSLCSTRFDVYEEAVAYEFVFATGLLAGLVLLWTKPAWSRCWTLCLVAGLGPLIRPTLLFYGVGTLLGALLVMVSVSSTPRRPGWHRLLFACLLFGLGGVVLFVTNAARFGAGFEFGHKLNVQTLFGSLYVTRFDHPFAHEPIIRAARELFGLLFQVHDLSGGDYYMKSFFPGQSPTVRWREMYFTTFDLTWLPLILLGWGLGLYALWKRGARSPDRGQTARGEPGEAAARPLPLSSLVALWSFLPAVILAGFYLRNCVVSARYMTDIAPAFTAALVALVLGWPAKDGPSRHDRLVPAAAAVALLGWQVWQVATLRNSYGSPNGAIWPEVQARHARPVPSPEPVADHYSISEPGSHTGGNFRFGRPWGTIPYNGVGWDHGAGLTQPVVIAYVRDAKFIELDLRSVSGTVLTEADLRWVRVKVGLELLKLESAHLLSDGTRRLRFAAPAQASYRAGLQVAYMAFGPPELLEPHVTPYRLVQVRWR